MDLNSKSFIGGFFQSVNPDLDYLFGMSWNEKIIDLRRGKGLSRAELARMAGVSYDSLNKYERGEIEQPRGDTLSKIATALGTTEIELRFGDKAQSRQGQGRDGLVIQGEIAAGLWLEADLFETEKVERSSIAAGDSRHPAAHQYLLRVRGESLNKTAQDGDLLLCLDYAQSGTDIENGDLVVVERSRDGGHTIERTAKRIFMNGDRVELRPESTDPRFQEPIAYDEHGEESSEVRIIAKVLWVLKKG